MSTVDEKSAPNVNVLTITRPTPARQTSNQSINVLSTIHDVDSTHSMSPPHSSGRNEKSLDNTPFYNPAASQYSVDQMKSESKQDINVIQSTSYDTDVEACLTPQKTQVSYGGKTSLLKNKSKSNMECTVWPGQKALKQKKKAMRRERGKYVMCGGCMAGLSKKTRTWVKVLIALLIVGIAVGVGVGISRAVGGGVWKSKNNVNAPIDTR